MTQEPHWSWGGCKRGPHDDDCTEACAEPDEESWIDRFINTHIASLGWSADANEYLKTIVAGNIRHFGGRLYREISGTPERWMKWCDHRIAERNEELQRINKALVEALRNILNSNSATRADQEFYDSGAPDYWVSTEALREAWHALRLAKEK